MVGSVQQAFKIFSFLSILYSCTTYTTEVGVETRQIIIDTPEIKNNNQQKLTEITNIKDSILPKAILDGSISTLTLLGSDLWIGSLGGGINRYNLHTQDIKEFGSNTYSIKDFSIKKIISIGDKIYILQSDRITSINKKNEKLTVNIFPIDITRGTDMAYYKGEIYISTLGYGIYRFNIDTKIFSLYLESISYISSLFIDNDKLFVGSMDNGLYVYNFDKKVYEVRLNYPQDLFRKNILHISKNKTQILLGTAKKGLIKWDIITNQIDRLYPTESVSFIYVKSGLNVVSFIGKGVLIEEGSSARLESIDTFLLTNNITSSLIFKNLLITGNIKKGLVIQEFHN